MSLFLCISLAASALAATRSPAVDYLAFRNSTLAKIEANSIAATSKSWELGTNFAALTYRHAYNLSEFGTVEPTYNTSFGKLPTAVIDGLDDVLARRSRNTKLLAFMVDGAAADPARYVPGSSLLSALVDRPAPVLSILTACFPPLLLRALPPARASTPTPPGTRSNIC